MKLKDIENALGKLTDNLVAPGGILDRFEKGLDQAQGILEGKGEVISKLAQGKNLKQATMNRLLGRVDKRVDKLVQTLGGKEPKA
jgi:hypothetical protein